MNAEKIDKELLKSVITDILIENPDYFKEILSEILIENKIIISQNKEERVSKLEKMIQEDFERYEEVFKALA